MMSLISGVTAIIRKASKKDISFLVKTFAISIFIIAVGIAVCLVIHGSIEVDVDKPPPTSSK